MFPPVALPEMPPFRPLPPVPDQNALELEILERWERDDTFGRLRAQLKGGPKWSFTDGPVTANKKLAVHTAWGRTLKDVFQRYKALRGFDQRFQNGFDCQGLWIEVGVERDLGLTRSARSRSTASTSSRETAATWWSGQPGDHARLEAGSASGWTGVTTTSR